MKELKDAIINIKEGAVLTINKYNNRYDGISYASCLLFFDGSVFKDVKEVNIGDFLRITPNVQRLLDNGYIYKVNYLRDENKYQSTIIKKIREGGYKETFKEETVNNFQVQSDDFFDSIVELDTKIAGFSNADKNIKEKVLV